MATGKTNALALCNCLMQIVGFMRTAGFMRRVGFTHGVGFMHGENFSRTNPGVPSQT